jgi:aromatic ring-opening dioxygenase catalytic subunit (LigB family)
MIGHLAVFLSHGGGPLPLLGDASHEAMVRTLEKLAATIGRPRAIVVASAHWEAGRTTITAGANPPLIYDYYGFPKESYDIEYPCPGAPDLARDIARMLAQANIESSLDENRGFDHGVFVPLKIMYPQADIPCVQLSLLNSLDPTEHMRLGHALRGLACESVLFVGSGFSFHNLNAFFAPETKASRSMNASFESWLIETLSDRGIDETQRKKRLANWSSAPFARYCHPREEHLLPLHVCYGIASQPCSEAFELEIFNKKASMYSWRATS